MSIDWSKPIEAVHEDGTIGTIEPLTIRSMAEMAYGGHAGHGHRDAWRGGWRNDGSPISPYNRWRIRNVASRENDADAKTVANTVDWNQPIEAVHTNGAIFPVECWEGFAGELTNMLPGGWVSFETTGAHASSKCPWRIRNVDMAYRRLDCARKTVSEFFDSVGKHADAERVRSGHADEETPVRFALHLIMKDVSL